MLSFYHVHQNKFYTSMENSDSNDLLENILSAEGLEGAAVGGRQGRITDTKDFVQVGSGLQAPDQPTIEDFVMEGSVPLPSNVRPIRGDGGVSSPEMESAQLSNLSPGQIEAELDSLVSEHGLEETNEAASSVENLKDEIKVRHQLMMEHSLADLAAAIKNGQKAAQIDKDSVSLHKLWVEMSLMEKIANPAFKRDANGVPEASILRSFIANNAPLSSKTSRIKTVLIPHDLYPRDDALGLAGVDFGRPGHGALEIGQDAREHIESLVKKLTKSQSSLHKAGEALVDTLNSRSGLQKIMGRLSENIKVQSAYRNYESAATELIEYRNYLLSKDIDTNEFDREIGRTELFTDLFVKRETTSWEAMANTQRRIRDIARKLNDGTYQQTDRTKEKGAESVGQEAISNQKSPSVNTSLTPLAADVASVSADSEDPKRQQEDEKPKLKDMAMTIAGVTYMIPSKSPLANVMDPANYEHLDEDRTYIHPEIPIMWEIAKIEAEDNKDFETLKKLKKGIPRSLTRLQFEGYHRDPAKAIENFIRTGFPHDMGAGKQHTGKIRSIFGESSSGKKYKEFVSSSSVKNDQAFCLGGPPDAGMDMDFPIKFPSGSRFAKENLPNQNAPAGKKLAHPLLALAWEINANHVEIKIAENTIPKRGFFSKEIKPSLIYKKSMGAVDAFGEPIEFPDCFYVENDADIKGGSAMALVAEYKDLASKVGNARAKTEFADTVRDHISQPTGLKAIDPYFLRETDVVKDSQLATFENKDMNAHKDKMEIELRKLHQQEERSNPQAKHNFNR